MRIYFSVQLNRPTFRHSDIPKPLQGFRCLSYIHSATSATHLFLELLNPKVNSPVRRAVRSVPVDGLLGVVAIAFNGEVVLVRVGEVALLINAKVQHAGTLRQSGRVGPGQPDGENSLLDNVEVLETGGSGGLGGEGDSASIRGRVDCLTLSDGNWRGLESRRGTRGGLTDGNLVGGSVSADIEVF